MGVFKRIFLFSSVLVLLLGGMDCKVYASTRYSQADINLLARLIESEACGESYLGKLAVGSVVINRSHMDHKTLSQIIYQPYQFSGVKTWRFRCAPSRDSLKAAKEVLSGRNVMPNAYFFVNLKVARPSWSKTKKLIKRVGNHWFYTKW